MRSPSRCQRKLEGPASSRPSFSSHRGLKRLFVLLRCEDSPLWSRGSNAHSTAPAGVPRVVDRYLHDLLMVRRSTKQPVSRSEITRDLRAVPWRRLLAGRLAGMPDTALFSNL
jgi:hypothetical protein